MNGAHSADTWRSYLTRPLRVDASTNPLRQIGRFYSLYKRQTPPTLSMLTPSWSSSFTSFFVFFMPLFFWGHSLSLYQFSIVFNYYSKLPSLSFFRFVCLLVIICFFTDHQSCNSEIDKIIVCATFVVSEIGEGSSGLIAFLFRIFIYVFFSWFEKLDGLF